jgi:primosomal protein N'
MISIDIDGTDIILITDNHTLPEVFKYDTPSMVFDFKSRQMVWGSKKESIYESSRISKKSGLTKIKFKVGWGILLLNMFKSLLSPDDKEKILNTIYSSNFRTVPFPNLRDYQNEDILHLLKYKYGLFSCYTGYGKSEIIATVINYVVNETNDKILILVPSKKIRMR